MKDRFKELSTQCMKELTEVFERMDDSNVRELLEEIKKTLLQVPHVLLPEEKFSVSF